MYVQRENGKIIASFANEQDYATEWLDDDSLELVAFLTPAPSPVVDPVTKLKNFLAANPDVAALLNQ